MSDESSLIRKSVLSKRSPKPKVINYNHLVSTANPQQDSDFFNLAGEIRNEIYKLVLVDVVDGTLYFYGSLLQQTIYTALLKTCRLAYVEAMPLLYGCVRFTLTIPICALGFLREIGTLQLEALRNISFTFSVHCEASEKVFQKVSKCCKLDHLEFRITTKNLNQYLAHKEDPLKWHPVTTIRGLKKVTILLPNVPTKDFKDFQDFKKELSDVLLSPGTP